MESRRPLFNAINDNSNISPALPRNNSSPSPPSVPAASACEMSSAHHPHSPASTSPSNDTCTCSNNNTSASTCSRNAFFVRSHLAIVSAMQSNIGCRYHRQNDARRAMEWYLESIRTKAALYALPTPSQRVNNSNCNRDVSNKEFTPSSPHPKRRRVSNCNTTNNGRSHDGPASSQHDRHATSNVDDANLLVKYLYEATAIEAIEVSSHPQNPPGFDVAQHEHGEVGNDGDGDASDSDYEDDDDATFGSIPLDEDEEEELSSFLRSNDIVSTGNNLSTETTSRFIGLNHFTSPITIDLSKGMMKTAAGHQQEHQDDGDNNNSSACMCYEYDADAHAAITLFNMSLLHQQDGNDLETYRRYLDVGLHLLTCTQQASLSKSSLRICLSIMLHTNLGYISYISDDNDSALWHFTMAFSIVCHAVERTLKDIESTEKGSDAPSNQYLQSKRACHYYYCRAEVAALINVARSCEADGLYEIALRACTSAIQRLQSNASLLGGDDLPFCTVQSAIDADHQAFEEQLALRTTFGSAEESSFDLNSAMFVMASINSQLANDEEALRYYVAYFHHVTDRYGPDHPHATAAILGINLIQLLTRCRMSLAAGAA